MSLEPSTVTFPKVIAHRGLSSLAPENTLAAISLAAEKGMKWIEVDVKLSADEVFVLFHDESLERTTNSTGKISELKSSEIFSLNAGSWFDDKYKAEKIPQLEEVLQLCVKLNLGINLELKPELENIKGFSEKLNSIIKRYQRQSLQILVSSFNKEVILNLHKINPEISLGFLIDKKDEVTTIEDFCKKINCISIHIPDKYCTKKNLIKLQALNKFILVYTVNSSERAKQLFSMGINSVFSNKNLAV